MLKIIVMLDSRRVNKYYIGKFSTKEAYLNSKAYKYKTIYYNNNSQTEWTSK